MRLSLPSALLCCTLASTVAAQLTVDVLIRGGSVIDGTGALARRADVGIRGDRIFFIGNAIANGVAGTRVIDATGLVVTAWLYRPAQAQRRRPLEPRRRDTSP